jgi:hypothetical protein
LKQESSGTRQGPQRETKSGEAGVSLPPSATRSVSLQVTTYHRDDSHEINFKYVTMFVKDSGDQPWSNSGRSSIPLSPRLQGPENRPQKALLSSLTLQAVGLGPNHVDRLTTCILAITQYKAIWVYRHTITLSGPFQQTFPPFPAISQKVGPRVRMDCVTRSELLINMMF